MPEKVISQKQLDELEVASFFPGVGVKFLLREPDDSLKKELMKKEDYIVAFSRRKIPHVFDHGEITDDSFETVIIYGKKHADFVQEVLKKEEVIFDAEKAQNTRHVDTSLRVSGSGMFK